MKTKEKLYQLRKKKDLLLNEITLEEHKIKKSFGIAKNGEWFKTDFGDENDNMILVFYYFEKFIAMNSDFDCIYSCLIYDLKNEVESADANSHKIIKISKDEAFQLIKV